MRRRSSATTAGWMVGRMDPGAGGMHILDLFADRSQSPAPNLRATSDRRRMAPLRKIIYVYTDAFYASVEQSDDPEWGASSSRSGARASAAS